MSHTADTLSLGLTGSRGRAGRSRNFCLKKEKKKRRNITSKTPTTTVIDRTMLKIFEILSYYVLTVGYGYLIPPPFSPFSFLDEKKGVRVSSSGRAREKERKKN